MSNETLPQEAIAVDHQLVEKSEVTVEQLARHRWHWTKDLTNPNRVTVQAYATACGSSVTAIRMYALGYESYVEDVAKEHPLRWHMEMSALGANRQFVVKALSEELGLNVSTLRADKDYNDVTKRIALKAETDSKDGGETFEEAASRLVKFHKQKLDSDSEERKRFRDAHGARFLGVENELTKARNALHKALLESNSIDWTNDERKVLGESLRRLTSLVHLVDVSVTGTANVDWDKELRELGVA